MARSPYNDTSYGVYGTPTPGGLADTPQPTSYGGGYAAPAKSQQEPSYGKYHYDHSQPDPFSSIDNTANGVFNSPGYDEQYYRDHFGQWTQPSAAEQNWNAVQGTFAAGPSRNTGAQQGYDQWFDPLTSTKSFSETGAAQGPRGSNYEAGAYGDRNLGTSRSSSYTDAGGPSFTNYSGAAYGGGANNTTFDSGAAFDRYFNPLSQESNSEKLYGQDPGLGAYYSRAQQTGQEQIDNAMAARGLFSSGASADESRQLAADLGADRAKNEANYKLQAAGQADTQRNARMGLAGQLGSAADAASLGRSTNERNWASLLDTNDLQREQQRTSERQFADTEDRARDAQSLDWTKALDASTLANSADARAWAQAGDTSNINRSQEARSWSDLLNKEQEQNNRDTLDYAKAGTDAATASDTSRLAGLQGGMSAATTANASLTKRYEDQFNNLLDLAKAKAGQVSGAVDSATQAKVGLALGRIQAILAAAKNGQALSQQQKDELDGDLALAYSVLSGDPSGLAKGGGGSPGANNSGAGGNYSGASD